MRPVDDLACARAQLGAQPGRVVVGRPIRFDDEDDKRDALAETTLRRAAENAGLGEVTVAWEAVRPDVPPAREVSGSR